MGIKKILFPSRSVFTIQGRDTIEYQLHNKYRILTYVDSLGCMSCKLNLSAWTEFIHMVDSLHPATVQYLFFFSPMKRMEIYQTLLADRFKHPICIDEQDSVNILNNFPSETPFQTFLLNSENKVIAIGNPVHNQKVKDLYLKIIAGESPTLYSKKELQTSITLDKTSVDMGFFDWQQKQTANFTLTNIGKNLLLIEGSSTSCGCITVEYPKEPIQSGKSLTLKVKYKADHPEHFNKTITLYCNTKDNPLQLRISGNAK